MKSVFSFGKHVISRERFWLLIIISFMKTICRFFEFGPQSKGNEQGDDVTILAKSTRFRQSQP